MHVCTVNLNLVFAEAVGTDISGAFLLTALIIQHLESLTICKKNNTTIYQDTGFLYVKTKMLRESECYCSYNVKQNNM